MNQNIFNRITWKTKLVDGFYILVFCIMLFIKYHRLITVIVIDRFDYLKPVKARKKLSKSY